ncbi:MAG: dihydrofolate reductase [Candidatus Pacearchaeota archaeon]
MKKEIILIAAISDLYGKRVIGKENKLPWHFNEDLRRFRELTLNKPIIYGKNTALSIYSEKGSLLPKRYNLIVSKTLNEEFFKEDKEKNIYFKIFKDLESAINFAFEINSSVYIAGGQQIFEQTINLPLTSRLEISEIKENFEGDCFFPPIDLTWVLSERKESEKINFLTYKRILF